MIYFYATSHFLRKFMSNFNVTLHTLRYFIKTNYLVIARLKKEESDFPFFCWTEIIWSTEIKSPSQH